MIVNFKHLAYAALGISMQCVAAQSNAPATADFNRALAADYQALAGAEQAQGDHRDAGTYARRASAAAGGQPTAPDEVDLRLPFLHDQYVADLNTARQRLMSAMDRNARQQAPAAAARAQSSYDCWLEQAQEDLQPEDIAACRQSFEHAIGNVEAALVATNAPTPPPRAPAPMPTAAAPDRYLVFFDFNKANVTPEAMDVLHGMQASTDGVAIKHLVAVGHADTSGSDAYNLRLSQRRADAVKAAITGMDIPVGSIDTEARGEREPLVATGDGVREAQNRRVEITLER